MLTVHSLHVYPVKSLRGVALEHAVVGDRGFEHDRRFMVVDASGQFLTQRTFPRMALVDVTVEPSALRIAAPGRAELRVPLRPGDGETATVQVWRDRCDAISLGPQAARWFSDFLGVPCTLAYMPDVTVRPTSAQYPVGRVGFADAFPFLFTSTASLAELARRGADVPMERFRPNIVVEGAPPFAEDGWSRVRIGPVRFEMTKPCVRCSITTVDPRTGATAGVEPLRTLATFRRSADGDGVLFGMNAIHEGLGTISVGDVVHVG